MPYRARKRRRPSGWSAAEKLVLTTGRNILKLPARFQDLSDPLAKAAWKETRHELIPEHIIERPGTRPAAMYRFELFLAFGGRQRIAPVTRADEEYFTATTDQLFSGHSYHYENERQYLARLGQLQYSELRALAAYETEPTPETKWGDDE